MLTAKELLKTFATCELVEELAKREGVQEIIVPEPVDNYKVFCTQTQISNDRMGKCLEKGTGPVRILIVTD